MEFCVYNHYSSIIEILACYQETGYNVLVLLLLRCFLVYNNNEDISKMVYSIAYMIITHFDYIYDCITIETLVSVCVLCCLKIAILLKNNKEIRMMSSILVYNNTTLVNQYKYIIYCSDKFVIYKDLIRSRMYTLLNEHS
ncbi:ankyrin repeat protein [Magpiepox virus]|nr:ankyrin repeat protein [Magpiepox virus]